MEYEDENIEEPEVVEEPAGAPEPEPAPAEEPEPAPAEEPEPWSFDFDFENGDPASIEDERLRTVVEKARGHYAPQVAAAKDNADFYYKEWREALSSEDPEKFKALQEKHDRDLAELQAKLEKEAEVNGRWSERYQQLEEAHENLNKLTTDRELEFIQDRYGDALKADYAQTPEGEQGPIAQAVQMLADDENILAPPLEMLELGFGPGGADALIEYTELRVGGASHELAFQRAKRIGVQTATAPPASEPEPAAEPEPAPSNPSNDLHEDSPTSFGGAEVVGDALQKGESSLEQAMIAAAAAGWADHQKGRRRR